MADSQAWAEGAAIGSERAKEHRDKKERMSDEELQGKISTLIDNRKAIQGKLPLLLDDKGNPTPQYNDAIQQLTQNARDLREVYHPDKQPGAIEKFGHLLTDALHVTKPEDRIAKEGQKRATAAAGDEKTALGVAAAAPVSPEQAATTTANAGAAGNLASIQAALKNFDTLNPNASPQEKQSFLQDLIQKSYGTTARGNWTTVAGKVNGQPTSLLFDKNTRQYRTQSGEAVPTEILDQFVPDVKTTEASSKRADFDEFKKKNPTYDGSFEEWTALEAAKGRAKAPKPETLDTEYKAILVKKASGQPLTPDEQAHEAAWQLYNRETKIDPGVARAAAFGAMRYIPVLDPSNPENVVMMRAGEAAKAGVNTPQSIAFKTDTAITRYMTSGAGGTNITYFNTATDHLRLLKEAGDALNNGDYPLFNRYANQFATATGDPAPTNFEAVKTAVAGELSKTFKGTGATDSEISEINSTINQAQSPQQIQGSIDYYTSLMGSKVHALQLQYEAGKSGRPNFPGTTPSAGGGNTPPPAAKSKGIVSIAAAMQKPKYKGKTKEEVSSAITAAGYTPVD